MVKKSIYVKATKNSYLFANFWMTFFWFSFDFEIFELIKRSSHIFQKSAN